MIQNIYFDSDSLMYIAPEVMMALVSLSHKAPLGILVAGKPATEAIEVVTLICVANMLRERSLEREFPQALQVGYFNHMHLGYMFGDGRTTKESTLMAFPLLY